MKRDRQGTFGSTATSEPIRADGRQLANRSQDILVYASADWRLEGVRGHPQAVRKKAQIPTAIHTATHRRASKRVIMADDVSFTVILTKGVHLVDRAAANAIRTAIENGDRTVEVVLDPLGNADANRRTLVAVRHVIALAENGRDVAGPMPANVAPLRRSAGSAPRVPRI